MLNADISSIEKPGIGCILNSDIMQNFRCLFYKVTGLTTFFYFHGWQNGKVDNMLSKARPRFCKLIQGSPKGCERCVADDQLVINALKHNRKPVDWRCHAGLSSVKVPVFFNGRFEGAIFAGEFLTQSQSKKRFLKICKHLKDLDIDFVELEKAYNEIPVFSRKNAQIAFEFLSLMVNYIIDQEHIIMLQENIYKKQNELSNSLQLRFGIEKDLDERIDEIRQLRRQLLVTAGSGESLIVTEDDQARHKRLIQETMVFIDQYSNENIRITDAAEYVGITPNYLSSLFKQICGCTFTSYVTQKRIARACQLLKDMRMNVGEVAMEVGYEDASHFSRVFKKVMGISPGKFRDHIGLK